MTTQPSTESRWLRISLAALLAFVGVGAVPVGVMLMLDPSGGMAGFPLERLEGSIFPNYLVPGIFLFAVNGLASLAGAVLVFRCHPLGSYAALGLGAFLMAWIVVQVWSLGWPPHWLQIIYFVFGVVEVLLGGMLYRQR